MKKITFAFVLFACLLCSCRTSSVKKMQGDSYCFICSPDDKPVVGYCFYVDDRCIAMTNQSGFALIPERYAGQTVLAKKTGWETLALDENSFADGGVVCISARAFADLCEECSSLIRAKDFVQAQNVCNLLFDAARSNAESDVATAYASVISYKNGETSSSLKLLQSLNKDSAASVEFIEKLLVEVLDE